MIIKYQIRETTWSGGSCPFQWEGFLDDGRAFYIRYRWGGLSFSISHEPTDSIEDAVGANIVFFERIGEELDGYITESEVLEALKNGGITLDRKQRI